MVNIINIKIIFHAFLPLHQRLALLYFETSCGCDCEMTQGVSPILYFCCVAFMQNLEVTWTREIEFNRDTDSIGRNFLDRRRVFIGDANVHFFYILQHNAGLGACTAACNGSTH